MMFDWNDQDQVGDTLWDEFSESEDHIVPTPKEGNTLVTFGDWRKKRRNESNYAVRLTEQTSGAKNDFPAYHLENHFSYNAKEEFSSSRLEMDAWPDLPNLSAELIDGYNDGNDLDSFTKELMNDLSNAPNLNSVGAMIAGDAVQQDGEPELISHEKAGKGSGIFLDFDWANVGDFGDLDGYFRNNDSIFGHETLGSADGFVSPSADVISSTTQSIPMPDLPLCKYQPLGQGCSSSQVDEHSDQGCPLKKEKVDGQKRLLRSEKKAEKSKNKFSKNSRGAWDHNNDKKPQIISQPLHTSLTTAPHTFPSESAGQFGSVSQVMYNEYGYSTYPFPAIPRNHIEGKQKQPIPVGDKVYPDSVKSSNSLEKLSDLSKPVIMTPQEKLVKLRQRQQMQAMLAIQKQQQHYCYQITGSDNSVSPIFSLKSQSQDAVTSTTGMEECANKLPSSEQSLIEELDESERVLLLIEDKSLEEIIYYQLQHALQKLDVRVRLCIRESLFRLARGAVDRQSASDRSSTDKNYRDEDDVIADEEMNKQDRSARLPDSETDTNHIDRIVAHLLFHRPPESCPKPTKISQSPSLQVS